MRARVGDEENRDKGKGVTTVPVSINVAGLFPPDISCCRAKIHLSSCLPEGWRGNGYRSIACPREWKAAGQTATRRLGGRRARKKDGNADRPRRFPPWQQRVETNPRRKRGEGARRGRERVERWLVY